MLEQTFKNTRHGALPGNGYGGFCIATIQHPSPGSFNMEVRYCKTCGKELVRKRFNDGKIEGPKQFSERHSCNSECMYKGRKKALPQKYCEYCGKKLKRKIRPNGRMEAISEMSNRKFCDLYCRGKSYRIEFDKKFCLYCGKELKRRDSEASITFRPRKYCNHECYSRDIMVDNPVDSTRYGRLRNSREKYCCIICGATERLHNHHIDKDLKNDSDENIVTLCPSCHTRVHAISRKWERQNAEFRN